MHLSHPFLIGILSYRWGGAVVIGVNVLVFPISSEKELRQTLVASLDHIGTFAHLLAKTYTMAVTDEDRQLRDQLSRTIRVGLVSCMMVANTYDMCYL